VAVNTDVDRRLHVEGQPRQTPDPLSAVFSNHIRSHDLESLQELVVQSNAVRVFFYTAKA
jgi:hypothetical protein